MILLQGIPYTVTCIAFVRYIITVSAKAWSWSPIWNSTSVVLAMSQNDYYLQPMFKKTSDPASGFKKGLHNYIKPSG